VTARVSRRPRRVVRGPGRGAVRRIVRRDRLWLPDATLEPEPGPPPEAVFDRVTGPYARRAASAGLAARPAAAYDEEL
jgi:hypothetical protein